MAEPEAAASVKSWRVPLRLTVCGLPAALSVNERVPEAAPAEVGAKLTATVQVDPAVTAVEVKQVVPELAMVNGPVMVIPVKVRLASPVLVRVTDCAALLVPSACPAKVSEEGAKLTTGAAVAVPVKGNVCGTLPPPPALTLTVSVPLVVPLVVGSKPTVIEQFPWLARVEGVKGQLLVWEKLAVT